MTTGSCTFPLPLADCAIRGSFRVHFMLPDSSLTWSTFYRGRMTHHLVQVPLKIRRQLAPEVLPDLFMEAFDIHPSALILCVYGTTSKWLLPKSPRSSSREIPDFFYFGRINTSSTVFDVLEWIPYWHASRSGGK